MTVPLTDRDSVATFYEKVQAASAELDAKINPPKTIAYYIEQYAMKRSLSQGSVWQYNHALKGFTLDVDDDDRLVAEILARTDIKDTSKKRMIGIINTFFQIPRPNWGGEAQSCRWHPCRSVAEANPLAHKRRNRENPVVY